MMSGVVCILWWGLVMLGGVDVVCFNQDRQLGAWPHKLGAQKRIRIEECVKVKLLWGRVICSVCV